MTVPVDDRILGRPVPRRAFIAGNWKMHTDADSARRLASEVVAALPGRDDVDVALCPPAPLLPVVIEALRGSRVTVGAQNLHDRDQGAFTGEVSGPMLASLGVRHVIVGHSERRALFGEDDAWVARKLRAAFAARLAPILCVGETLEQRETGITQQVLRRQLLSAIEGLPAFQLRDLTLAYEPVWAIGTGRTATPQQAGEVHAFIRDLLAERSDRPTAEALRIQYGGSVKPGNIAELMAIADIDGALVGGASLEAGSFAAIVGFQG